MWVFCCGMQRSGSTLQFQLTAHLVEAARLGRRVEWVRPGDFPNLRDQLAPEPGWKVFKIHVCTPEMAAEFNRNNAMGVHTYRDLRDVFVSTMRKYQQTFEDLMAGGFLALCLEQHQQWTGLPRVLATKYEDMIANLPAEVERLAAHLGIAVGADTCRQIAEEHSIDRQRARIEESARTGDLREGILKGMFYNPVTNLHTNHIHEGAVGAWAHVLSPAQVQRLEAEAGDWLVEHGYELAGEKAGA
jgi:hypothetical protein